MVLQGLRQSLMATQSQTAFRNNLNKRLKKLNFNLPLQNKFRKNTYTHTYTFFITTRIFSLPINCLE